MKAQVQTQIQFQTQTQIQPISFRIQVSNLKVVNTKGTRIAGEMSFMRK